MSREVVHRYDQRGSGRSRSDGPLTSSRSCLTLTRCASIGAISDGWSAGIHGAPTSRCSTRWRAQTRRLASSIWPGPACAGGSHQDAQRQRLARLSEEKRAELAQLQHQLAGGDTAVTDRFQRLTWTTDFADRRHARVLDHRPLYHFPRSEHVFRAASDSYKTLLDSGVEDRVRHLDMPVLVMHGAQDTDPARARKVAELAPKGDGRSLNTAHCPWLEEPLVFLGRDRGTAEAAAHVGNRVGQSRAATPPPRTS